MAKKDKQQLQKGNNEKTTKLLEDDLENNYDQEVIDQVSTEEAQMDEDNSYANQQNQQNKSMNSFSFNKPLNTSGGGRIRVKKRIEDEKANSPTCGCLAAVLMIVFAIAQAALSFIGSNHVVGFIFAVLMIALSLLLIACDGLYSRNAYQGSWCNICCCIKAPENMARICFSISFRILFILLILVSMCFSAVQIINLVKDPRYQGFPEKCPDQEELLGYNGSSQQSQYCLRITDKDFVNAQSLMQDGAVMTYNLHNGLNNFRNQIYNCLTSRIQFKVTHSEDMTIMGSKADWFLGLASDYAIKIKKCEGQDYSVYFQSSARYSQFINTDTEIIGQARDFYSCLASKMPQQSHVVRSKLC